MSNGQVFRAFVKERLSAAVEDICAHFESTIADYEEEVRRSKHENQRLQRLLDSALSPRVVPVTAAVQLPSLSPGLTPHIKEEPNIKQEEEQLQVSVRSEAWSQTGLSMSVKTEESSEHREDTQGEDIEAETCVHREDIKAETFIHREDIKAETHVHSETEGDTDHSSDTDGDEDWRAPVNCSPAHMDTGADEDECAPETRATVNNGDMAGTGEGAESSKHKCSICKEIFVSKYKLQSHRRVHTGEEPLSCSVCKKEFPVISHLKRHMRTHTGEKPFSCSVCKKEFGERGSLNTHMRTHTGEKPFSCSVCKKEFSLGSTLKTHMRTHTGEKPFSCSVCKKLFSVNSHLKTHMRIHTGEKPFKCSVCKNVFTARSSLRTHMMTHREEIIQLFTM
ncbi:hypothetical protein NL108_013119 [Boleophthalmus pectinirostris]|uniref:zinc finger protein 182-like n=1 Tax=Boleophthalmus pectinirostris TaxID=150288 RepID=UPI00242DCDFD|nr:zinc finger protein 182-like [Boleophthalmus pectinirostris]KAJ0070509.1 hypothetical protein NL108_013119 [Boleophthalmus pectinirostris]